MDISAHSKMKMPTGTLIIGVGRFSVLEYELIPALHKSQDLRSDFIPERIRRSEMKSRKQILTQSGIGMKSCCDKSQSSI